MKTTMYCLLAAMFGAMVLVTGCTTSHTETDKPGLFGGNTHEETTTTENPVTGDTSTTHKEQKTTVNPLTGDTSTSTKQQTTGN